MAIEIKKEESPIPSLATEVVDVRVRGLEVAKQFRLDDQRIVRIYEGKAKHMTKAQKMMASDYLVNGKPDDEMLFPCMMSLLVTLDNKCLSPEDWADMCLPVYNKIFPEFAEVNF